MSAAPDAETVELRLVEDEPAVTACWKLMRQLRPHLESEAELVARWRFQAAAGYRLVALWRGARPVALAGFRVQENLVYGPHLYVDDLVTDEAERSGGHGARLMDWLAEEGRAFGCARLVLDTPLTNVLGHRFYYRCGLLATALRFGLKLA
ncbi:GNAT family N-acetyltransferase [Mycobacterium sp. KBS0706]|uniref:GNAT family N-acetyltransferase n=1 Tax=Mycobacterium sp. KBS0706 TaxID=2578109 RepID=UPI00110F8FCA|nr:GNAT family N-acetyltransferase [Mycobacterium sp. KBS0706]TSD88320.1 GNAT family N-acetyltransferase [Mycobacterium sp. KBS0706]